MTMGINKKERVNSKVKKNIERKEHINQIYKADEATRRAIDTLYVRRGDYRRALALVAGIVLFIGMGIGMWVGMNMTHTSAAQNVVKVEVLGDSKNQSQPQQQ